MPVLTIEKEKFNLVINTDDDPTNPRDYEHDDIFVAFHNKYDIGDKGHGYKTSDFNSWKELQDKIEKDYPGCIILPVHMIDHSGIALSTKPFASDPSGWDSGQVGFIFLPADKLCGCDPEKFLQDVIETYNQFVQGQVYGFELKDKDNELTDSCYGFYAADDVIEMILDTVELTDDDKQKIIDVFP